MSSSGMTYLYAVAAAFAATALRFGLEPVLHGEAPLLVPLGAAVIVAAGVGFGPGLLSLIIGLVLGLLLYIEPVGSLVPTRPEDMVRVGLYLGEGTLATWLVGTRRDLWARGVRQAALIDLSPDAILVRDVEGRIRSWSTGATEMYGYECADVIGVSSHELLRTVAPRPLHELAGELVQRRVWQGELVHTTRSGEQITVWSRWRVGADGEVLEVNTDITELKRTEHEIRQLNAELEARVEERTRELSVAYAELEAFSYTIAHDLRAPLRNMHSLAEALVEDFGADLPDDGRAYTRRIVVAATRMDQLISDLLAYARLARERLRLEPVDLDHVLADVIDELRPAIEDQHAVVEVEPCLGKVCAHLPTLRQVVGNLLGNAIKFVAPGEAPALRVMAEPRETALRLWVEDEGIGIQPEHVHRIFRVFERLHAEETYPGTGIGLAIVKKGAERMGGSCGVESVPGQGSRFWIELPKVVNA